MALGILGAYGGLNKKEEPDFVIVGELSLDGGLRECAERCPLPIATRVRKKIPQPARAGVERARGRRGRGRQRLPDAFAARRGPLSSTPATGSRPLK
jgi:hypothetical protein